jgi:hypothetical protein
MDIVNLKENIYVALVPREIFKVAAVLLECWQWTNIAAYWITNYIDTADFIRKCYKYTVT